ncbi:MAG: hypothetical protein Q9183_002739 [Haloplaca sp. 2 TL-2023]
MSDAAMSSSPPATDERSRTEENGQAENAENHVASGTMLHHPTMTLSAMAPLAYGTADYLAASELNGTTASDKALADNPDVETTPATAQTPASGKKASNGSSKKKAAVPEHKTKKLNRKASKATLNLEAQPGQYYLARMKGHPPWPSIICDEEMLPMSLLDTRPVTTKMPDGTYKRADYADGGKRVQERTFPIMFLHTNEFAWMPNTDLTPLKTETIDPDNTKGKSRQLASAFAKASEQNDLRHFKDMLADHQKAVKEDAEAQAERDAKKATKSKRKSVDTAAASPDDADDMDLDEEVEAPKSKSKKRKKDADSDAEDKPAKTPKTGTKLKLSTPKTPVEPSSKKKAAKPKSSTKKAARVSDDDAVETPQVEEKRMTAEEARQAKEKRILYFRHKLQRGFLSRDVPPKEDEMAGMSDFLAELETYTDLEGSIIRTTKINKVLKAMIKLPSIPQNEIYQFKERCLKLLGKWNEILSNDAGAGTSGEKDDEGGKADDGAPTTNGTTKDTEAQAVKAEAGEAEAPEEEDDATLKNKIGTTTDGAEEAEEGNDTKPDEAEKADAEEGDGPDVDNAPTKEYQPPAIETEA